MVWAGMTMERTLALQLPRKLAFGANSLAAGAEWIGSQNPAAVLIVTSPQMRSLCRSAGGGAAQPGRNVQVWDGVSAGTACR